MIPNMCYHHEGWLFPAVMELQESGRDGPMDGYIKNKKEALHSVRKGIFWKYAISFPILLFIPVWLFGIYSLGSPEDWQYTEVVYSHISSEAIGLQRGKSDVFNAEDGRKYVIPSKFLPVEHLQEMLVPGETYCLVYSETIAGGDHIEALYNAHNTFLDHAVSGAVWEKERQEGVLALYITIGLEMLALFIIDRLWCKEEHARIQKLRQDMEKRNSKNRINEKI